MSSAKFSVIVVIISVILRSANCQIIPSINDFFRNVAQSSQGLVDTLNIVRVSKPTDRVTTPQRINLEGYYCEEHEVTTNDGYILSLYRIPGRPGSPGVFLQHGLLGSSYDWVLAGRNKALAFILADLGYDVWLGNSRGSTFSRKHKTLSANSYDYWNFEWHHMGIYDLPAALDYVTRIKNDRVVYIGHSMGTTQFYVFASELPDFAAQKVKIMFSLSPVAFMSHMKSPLRVLGEPFARYGLEMFYRTTSRGELMSNRGLLKFFGKNACDSRLTEDLCSNLLFIMCGFDWEQFNRTLLPRVLHDFPSGSSVYTILHYGQMVKSGIFQKYDYGQQKNMEVYKQPTAPVYDLSKIKVPIAFFWGQNDWLADPKDVETLWKLVPSKMINHRVEFSKFNHLDFLWAIDAPELVYRKLISVMEEYK